MADAPFWNSPLAEAKKKLRFKIIMGNVPPFLAKSAQIPKPSRGQGEVYHTEHTFKFPGRVQWEDITVTFVDHEAYNTFSNIWNIFHQSGYFFPETADQLNTSSKRAAVEAMGNIVIQSIDYHGNAIEQWTLINGWLKGFDPGDRDYSSDDVVECTVTIAFDYAKYERLEVPTA